MNISDNITYTGKCIISGETFTFSKAHPDDAAEISQLYEQIRIDASNYKEKLSDDSPERFEQKGGMFVIMTEEEIAAEINSSDSFWALFRTGNGEIAGSFWFSVKNEYYRGMRYENISSCIYPREIVVSKKYGRKYLAQAMYYTCARAFLKAGYSTGAADLFRVTGYTSAEGNFSTDQTNIPSRQAVIAIGAEFDGPLPQRVIHLDGLSVTIEPQMYIFDYQKIASVCKNILREKNISVTQELQ